MGRLVRVLSDQEALCRTISGAMGSHCPPPPDPGPPPDPPGPGPGPPTPPTPSTEPHIVATPPGATPGSFWVEGAEWHYIASTGVEYAATGTAISTPTGAVVGSYHIEGEDWVYIDASGVKRRLPRTTLGAKAGAAVAGSYWVDTGAAAGRQWQWLSGSTRYQHWNGT